MSRRNEDIHRCHLVDENDSESGLPKVDPSAGISRRSWRRLRKLFLVSFHNRETHLYVKSKPALLQERKRHIRSKNWFVIHPLSIFAICREVSMLITWLLLIFLDPLIASFNAEKFILFSGLQLLIYIDIGISFVYGYIDSNTKNIVLDVKSIVKRYLLSSFIVDVLSCSLVPICLTVSGTWQKDKAALATCVRYYIGQNCVKLIKIGTVFTYLNKMCTSMNLDRQAYTMISMMLHVLILLHYSACYIFAVSIYLKFVRGRPDTFLDMADLTPDDPLIEIYFVSMVQACTLIFRSTNGIHKVVNVEETVLSLIITLSGYFYFCYILAVVYDTVHVQSSVGNKYEEVQTQLRAYMVQKNLPVHLRKRILTYYNYRFEKKYFREAAILDTLSEHLKYEIILFTCMPLVKKAHFFRNLSRSLVGHLIASLEREVYLPTDVIFKTGSRADKMYFIYCGTVAVYSREGIEVHHLQDGDNFGDEQLDLSEDRIYSAVSVEITELYSLKYSALVRYTRHYPQFWSQHAHQNREKMEQYQRQLEKATQSATSASHVVEDNLAII